MKSLILILSAVLVASTIAHCNISRNGRCGPSNGSTYCTPGAFCSRYSWCGVGAAWSAHSANSSFDGTAACVVAQQKPATKTMVLTNGSSHKVLDVNHGNFSDGEHIIQWSNHNGENQRWSVVYLNATEFQLIPMHNQQLSANLGGNHRLELGTRADEADQILSRNGNTIRNRHGKCMDVRGGSRRNGAEVIFWDCNGDDNQNWTMTEYTGSRRRLNK